MEGEDSLISYKGPTKRLVYHIRFHLADRMVFNFTNSKKNIILKTKLNNIWLFKSGMELIVEDSILVDNNIESWIEKIVFLLDNSNERERLFLNALKRLDNFN